MAAMHYINQLVDHSLVGPWSEVKVFVVHVLHPLGSYIMDVSGRITLCNVGFGDDWTPRNRYLPDYLAGAMQ